MPDDNDDLEVDWDAVDERIDCELAKRKLWEEQPNLNPFNILSPNTIMEKSHPWQSSREQFDQSTLPYLYKHGHAIGEKAREGNTECKVIMIAYEKLHRSFDPFSHLLLRKAIKDYDPEFDERE